MQDRTNDDVASDAAFYGKKAFRLGKSITDCPHQPGTFECRMWRQGYEIAERLDGPASTGDAA